MYLYLYSYRRETARQLRMYAQLTCCFSAVAELLVVLAVLDSAGLTFKDNGMKTDKHRPILSAAKM